jgi:hypothetical protein
LGKGNLEDLGEDGRVLKWIFKNWDGRMGWIDMAHDRDMGWGLVDAVTNLRFSLNSGKLLSR